MSASALNPIAAALMQAGVPALPTVIMVREVPIYEVEFAALEFAVEAELPTCDWAALALARALGEISPADVDAYLGLGEVVAECIVRRLLDQELLEERQDAEYGAAASAAGSSGAGFFQRLFGWMSATAVSDAVPARTLTRARKLRESRGPVTPVCRLSIGGKQALDRGVVAQRRVRPARLQFLAEPLIFVGVEDERKQTYTRHRRPAPLAPDRVPESLRVLDTTFALPPDKRSHACGIGTGIPSLPGQFTGIVPGTQWEVREVHEIRQQRNGREQRLAQVVLAAIPGAVPGGLQWRTFLLGLPGGTRECTTVEAAQILSPNWLHLPDLLKELKATVLLPEPRSLRRDGAFEIRCDGTRLPGLLGEADRPGDTWLPAGADGWLAGLRVHGQPSNIDAGRAAFFEFLRRRDAHLRTDFDGTCKSVATSLITYWDENPGLPSIEDAAINLWIRAELRAALCKRRLHRDLVAAYEDKEMAE